jgi:DNA-binding NarL/FixJ family response regulator
VLVERSSEMSLLQLSVSECLRGTGGLVLIRGPVGTGKTELLRAVARKADEAGARFLAADAVYAEHPAPLSALRQIFEVADLASDELSSYSWLLDDAALAAAPRDPAAARDLAAARDPAAACDPAAGVAELVAAPLRKSLADKLLKMSEEQPLVVGFDDAHLMDMASLECLVSIVRRINRARVLVVLVDSGSVRRSRPQVWAELLSQPNSRHIQVGPLSEQGVAEILSSQPGPPDCWQPSLVHRLTGGNPRLVRALIEPYCVTPPQMPVPGIGSLLAPAVMTCLYRGDAVLLRLAKAIAVLDDAPSAPLLGEMLDLSGESIAWAIAAATEAGLLKDMRLRHKHVGVAVLDATSQRERADLHRRAADVLHRRGAQATAVARHKIAAQHVDESWSLPVLRDAAEQALEADDVELAMDCLRLAERAATDNAQRADIRSAFVRVKWRLDPAMAEREMLELLGDAKAGRLRGEDTLALVNHLAWYGRLAEAAELFGQLASSAASFSSELAAAMHGTAARLAYYYPGTFRSSMLSRAGDGTGGPERPCLTTATQTLHVRFARAMEAVLTEGFTAEVLADAQAVLQQTRLTDATFESALSALDALAQARCLAETAFWCDSLLRQAQERHAATWCARLEATRAMISFRQGNLLDAEEHAKASLARVSAKGLGIHVGVPLSVLVLVAIRAGNYDEALSHLSAPVPSAMFETPVGLHYVRARGRYYLARHSYRAAMEEFEACGNLMIKWGIDLPELVPWRSDLAEGRLCAGDPARDLIIDQLNRLSPGDSRTRGRSLRLLAATSELRKRPHILREAISALGDSGDRLELADALTDLGRAQRSLGEYTQARISAERARQAVTGTSPRCTGVAVPSDGAEQETSSAEDEAESVVLKLSDAERRVASLAARGYKNHQIASKLFITVSTVEQHLTRAYRKLEISRRADLPLALLKRGVMPQNALMGEAYGPAHQAARTAVSPRPSNAFWQKRGTSCVAPRFAPQSG